MSDRSGTMKHPEPDGIGESSERRKDTIPAPEPAVQMESLELIARRMVEGLMSGRHRSPFRGSSVEFVEHREYTRGDEFRHIDWRAFGKTGRYYIKEFEDETNLRAEMIVDTSSSMAYSGISGSKFSYARALCASLSLLLLNQRDSVGLWLVSDQVSRPLNPTSNRSLFPNLAEILENAEPRGKGGYAEGIRKLLSGLNRRSLVVLISDFFDEPAQTVRMLEQLRDRRHDVVVLRIAAPEEEEFPFRQPTLFRGLEDPSNQILADPLRLRDEYLKQYQLFARNLDAECGRLGVDYRVFRTDQSLAGSIMDWLSRRRATHRSPALDRPARDVQ